MGVYMGKLRVGIEVPAYQVIAKQSNVEVRHYESCLTASVMVEDGSELQGGTAFMQLARYIGAFGKPENKTETSIKMTAPVVTSNSKGISAQQQQQDEAESPNSSETTSHGYIMSFVLPRELSFGSLPQPTNDNVKLRCVPERTVAVRYFSGSCNTSAIVNQEEQKLRESLQPLLEQSLTGYKVNERRVRELARYNDPFTPWFLRTNEIWLELVASDSAAEVS